MTILPAPSASESWIQSVQSWALPVEEAWPPNTMPAMHAPRVEQFISIVSAAHSIQLNGSALTFLVSAVHCCAWNDATEASVFCAHCGRRCAQCVRLTLKLFNRSCHAHRVLVTWEQVDYFSVGSEFKVWLHRSFECMHGENQEKSCFGRRADIIKYYACSVLRLLNYPVDNSCDQCGMKHLAVVPPETRSWQQMRQSYALCRFIFDQVCSHAASPPRTTCDRYSCRSLSFRYKKDIVAYVDMFIHP